MVGKVRFEARIRELVENQPDLAVLVEPMLIVRRVLREQIVILHRDPGPTIFVIFAITAAACLAAQPHQRTGVPAAAAMPANAGAAARSAKVARAMSAKCR